MGDEMTADRHIDREIARTLIRGAANSAKAFARTGSAGTLRGMRVSMTLTTPPIADEPNSKRGRAAQDLDPLGCQRVDRHLVVRVRRGHVERVQFRR